MFKLDNTPIDLNVQVQGYHGPMTDLGGADDGGADNGGADDGGAAGGGAAGGREQPRAGEGTPWLNSEQLENWRSLVALVMLLPGAMDAQLKRDSGLNTFEYHVLASLAEAPHHAVAMTDLAPISRGSVSRLSHAVARMEQAGWVERRSCRDAGRRTAAHLTPAGLSQLEEAAPGHVREARRLVVDALTPDQLDALGDAARAVIAILDPEIAETLGCGSCRS